jgi:hypothetical protein
MKGLLLLAALAALLAGCGSDDTADDGEDDPVLTNGALVTYTRTGGVAGLDERLRINPDETATLSYGEPVNTERKFELTGSQLDEIRSLLDQADFDSMPASPAPTGCADCFVYTVEYGGDTVTYDDATEPSASIAALVAALGELTDSHQPQAAGYIKGG